MTREEVNRWLGRYIEAWKTYDREQVEALFAEDISYRYHPYDDPIEGRDAVVESWLEAGELEGASGRDEPGTYDAFYRVVAADGDMAVAIGSSSYKDSPDGPVARIYDNCFVMRFDSEGRCREFTEWFMKRPSP
ncbi:MAG TPA: nuclear transport factor 2 family protein [Solirubrobacterales bacterium]|nr:nuclear transport factor 2 family protein [Solirubrobacterales bacterium]